MRVSDSTARELALRESSEGETLPAVIFASISTLESAGIQDSGNSTRSWMGILQYVRSVISLGNSFSSHPSTHKMEPRRAYAESP